MMHFKKSTALFVVLLLMLSLFAGCVSQESSETLGNSESTAPSASVPKETKPEETEPEDTEPEETDPEILDEYYWDVTVVYENGASGEYTFINPGLEGWDTQFDPKYMYQTFTVTPENNTFCMPIMDPSNWIVDNTPDWYKWVIIPPDGENAEITFTVVTGLTAYMYEDHGALEIHITLP